jgi:hypothetical protein
MPPLTQIPTTAPTTINATALAPLTNRDRHAIDFDGATATTGFFAAGFRFAGGFAGAFLAITHHRSAAR